MATKERIQEIMQILDITEQETLQMLQDDLDIDHDKPKVFDLSTEKAKTAKNYTKIDTHKAKSEKTKRNRKENPTKRVLIQHIFDSLTDFDQLSIENLAIINEERQISFKINEISFEITLTQNRKAK